MIKVLCSGVAACIGIFGVSAACTISPQAGRQYAYADNGCVVPDAIATIKRVIDTGDYLATFMNDQHTATNLTSIPTSFQQANYNADFTGLIFNLRFGEKKDTTSKLSSALQGVLQTMRTTYKNPSETLEQRTRFGYLYFLTLASSKALKERLNGVGTVYYDNASNSSSYTPSYAQIDGLTQVQSYTTFNRKNYTIRHSDLFYFFSSANSTNVDQNRRARSLPDLLNYLEYQNRLILVAPNGRDYGVRKHDDGFKVNRDNGSVLDNNFASFDAAKQLLDTCAVNTVVPAQYHAMCGFDRYGRE